MKKKIKILTSLSLSLVSLPLIAASCKKRVEPKNDGNSSVTTEENANMQNDSITPPTTTDTMIDSSSTHSNSEQGDQPSASENGGNGGTYAMPQAMASVEKDEAVKKQKEEEKDKENVEVVKKIVKEHKDAFGSFHTQGDFLEQISLYVNEKGISNLKLEDEKDKNKNLNVDSNAENKNIIKLQLGNQKFSVSLGKVLKDAVVTKYYFEDENDKIFDNHKSNTNDIERNWKNILTGNNKSKKTIVTQLGYYKQGSHIHLTLIPYHTSKVPDHLPLKVNSLLASFLNLESRKIDNLDKWDVKNIITFEQAFWNAKNFEQDLSEWKLKDKANISGIFQDANKMQNYVDKIAAKWNVQKNKLLKK
ncbi:Hypothetical protein, predicted lipoprotein, DUF285 family [Metamycoplasma auris 15026]|uniref:Lipoprotein n=1 Tax=Metamycoplasma auris 15026 TaxID=1188233 RepID=N9VA55_9BACT|nr:BspA family leucine-rich repeat surface protein [Metamycoplasma auris]ENY68573.1 Hypothetical protein, predicted lipoprotein, DUF285 family [Metamycoplasma auris 15026]